MILNTVRENIPVDGSRCKTILLVFKGTGLIKPVRRIGQIKGRIETAAGQGLVLPALLQIGIIALDHFPVGQGLFLQFGQIGRLDYPTNKYRCQKKTNYFHQLYSSQNL